jgi:hypothetical protein
VGLPGAGYQGWAHQANALNPFTAVLAALHAVRPAERAAEA